MAFQTGTATDPQDLLDKLRIFAQAQGWAVNRNDLGGSGQLQLSKGTQFVNIDSDNDNIYLRGSTGYDGGQGWASQPGSSSRTVQSNNMPGPYAGYRFFSDGPPDHVYAVVETTAGIYKHIVFGSLHQIGAYTGGAFVDAVDWNYGSGYIDVPGETRHGALFDRRTAHRSDGQVRADIDGGTDRWFYFSYTAQFIGNNRAYGTGRTYDWIDSLRGRTPNAYNELSVLLPIYVMAERPSSLFSLIGTAPNLRSVNIENLMPGTTITIGSDTWHIVPIIQKNGAPENPNSGNFGYAYKQVD